MKERPILFSAPMVRAILAGAKTQTRRQIETLGGEYPLACVRKKLFDPRLGHHLSAMQKICPYGGAGDRLYVRETFALIDAPGGTICAYRASCHGDEFDVDNASGEVSRVRVGRWRPAIHMPKACSRIVLDVVDVRVERLDDIDHFDALSEGVTHSGLPSEAGNPRDLFRLLWSSINGEQSWRANPWVWVVTFKRAEPT